MSNKTKVLAVVRRGWIVYRDVSPLRVRRGPMKGLYRFPYYPRPTDYRDSANGEWPIWSIGRALRDMPEAPRGSFFAAVDTRFYSAGESKDWECVWLR